MSTPRWFFVVFLLWIGATIWSNSLEPTKADLLPANALTYQDADNATQEMADPSLASASGVTKVIGWAGSVWKALIFDYAWFDGWTIGAILRTICVIFSIASLYFIFDVIWKVRSMLMGG